MSTYSTHFIIRSHCFPDLDSSQWMPKGCPKDSLLPSQKALCLHLYDLLKASFLIDLSYTLPTAAGNCFLDEPTRPFSLNHLNQKNVLLNILAQKENVVVLKCYPLKGYFLVVFTFGNLCLFSPI